MKRLLLSAALAVTSTVPAVSQTAEEVFRQRVDPTELHASTFIGMRVYRTGALDAEAYDGVQDGWDDIGEINDVIISRDGKVEAILVDIGGFLGIGENQVAVKMTSIRFIEDTDPADQSVDFFVVLNAPHGALEDAPTYGKELDAAGRDSG
jgi:hypothetical protein